MDVNIAIDRLRLALASAKATGSWSLALRTDEVTVILREYDRLVEIEKRTLVLPEAMKKAGK